MKQLYKFSSNFFLKGVLALVIICAQTWKTGANGMQNPDFRTPLTSRDTIKPRLPSDTNRLLITDTTFRLKLSSDTLDAPLRYSAIDSVVVLIKEQKILMYGKTKTDYKDISLTAPQVEVDQKTQTVTAVNRVDSLGLAIESPVFKDATNQFTSDTIRYNFKTGVGLTKNTYTQHDEMFVFGETAKKVNENTTFIKGARFTTCNLDDPHFAFVTNKMKVITQKVAVSGPTHPEFEGVPVPIYLPFGIYPLKRGQHSGLLPPQFATNEQFGLGLEGLGYYKVLSPYWDAKVYGNIYSYGGWTANLNPTYRKRYRYNGAFNISVQNTHLNFKGDPDYRKNKSFFVTWSHAMDSRARPGTSFSASVNAGSTKFHQYIPNGNMLNFQNQFGSSITYSKTWADRPYNLTLSANHDQNNFTRLINANLPDASFTMTSIYPFQRKIQVGAQRWYEKIGVGYNGNLRNRISFYDTAFTFRKLIDTLQWGAQHNFPLVMSLPPILGGAVMVQPNVSYSQVWLTRKVRNRWNTASQKVDTLVEKGFYTDHQMAFGISFNTAVYGTYQFRNSRLIAIRHVIRPSLSFNYRPDLSKGNYYTDTIIANAAPFRQSLFSGNIYPGFSEGRTGGISFGIDNFLEMKWRSKKDTGDAAIKKIRLIDGYGFNSGYNFLRDSMKLDIINIYLRTNLFEKINITANTILNPYKTDRFGRDIDEFAWEGEGFNLGRLSYGSVSVSTSLRSKPKDEAKEQERRKQVEQNLRDPALIADQRRLMEYMQTNPSEFVDFNIPWQVSLGYSLSFSTVLKPDLSGFEKQFSSNMNFNGSFSLTPKWNFSANGFYDFDTKQIQTFSMSINRDMHCWQMSISVTPVGLYRWFSFTISPKASLLQDLRINRTRSFTDFF
jgi:LPS-assembly protein